MPVKCLDLPLSEHAGILDACVSLGARRFLELPDSPRASFPDNDAQLMDRKVFDAILEAFEPALERSYPEKRPAFG